MKVITLYNNEKQLIKRARKGARMAQKAIYEQHSPKMLSVCRMYIKDLQYAEDVMLRGFFKVYTKLDTFKGKGSFEGWIRRIMVREAIDFLRAEKPMQFSDDLENHNRLKAVMPDLDSETDYLQEMIDELPEGYKVVFMMAAVEGYKHKEIAEVLEISVGTSKSQLAKARKMLQKKLTKENWKDGLEGSGK